jgi:hypothetical protein
VHRRAKRDTYPLIVVLYVLSFEASSLNRIIGKESLLDPDRIEIQVGGMNEKKLGGLLPMPGMSIADGDMWTANSSTLNASHPTNYMENYDKVGLNEELSHSMLHLSQSVAIGGTSHPVYLGSDINMTPDFTTAFSNTIGQISALSYNNS